VTKDIGRPKYFLEIEVARQKLNILLSQRKYALDLLEEVGVLGCNPAATPIEGNVDLWFDDNHALDLGRYRRLIGKLIYPTVTKPDITFAVGVLSRFMHQSRETHWLGAIRVFAYIKSCPGKELVYMKYGQCVFLDIRIKDILVTEETRNLLLGIAPLLEKI